MKVIRKESLGENYNMYPIQIPNPRQEWVNFGRDNMYPMFLLELMHKSAIHGAIQNGKHELTIGNGITFIGTENLTPESSGRLNKFGNMPNPNEKIEDVYFKLAYDQIIFGGYCLQVVWSKDRQTISEFYHMDFSKVRAEKADENGIIQNYWYSDDWSQYRKKEYAPIKIKAFDINDRSEPVQLMYMKDYFPAQW
jgi:hypothetical protein